jgi:hypothetical protein
MAIIGTPVLMNAGRSQNEDGESKGRTEVWLVKTQFGVGDEMNIALSHAYFRIGKFHPSVRGIVLLSKSAELASEGSTSVWYVTLEWGTQSTSGNQGNDTEDPLSKAPLFDWGEWTEKIPVFQDKVTGNLIQTTCADPIINPPLFEDYAHPQVTIRVNESDYFEDRLIRAVGCMNSAPFRIQDITVPQYCAKLISYRGSEEQLPNGEGYYFKSTYVFKLRFLAVGPRTYIVDTISPGNGAIGAQLVPEGDDLGFRRKVFNAGTRELGEEALPTPIVGDKGEIITEPVALGLDGRPIKGFPFGQEIYLLHNTLEQFDFNPFPTVRER